MAVGAFIYVGRSRLRKKRRSLKGCRKKKSESGSPGTDQRKNVITTKTQYTPYIKLQDQDDDFDTFSSSSCGSEDFEFEDFLPLLDLRPHSTALCRINLNTKMPFGPFKKKADKKEDEEVKRDLGPVQEDDDTPVVIEGEVDKKPSETGKEKSGDGRVDVPAEAESKKSPKSSEDEEKKLEKERLVSGEEGEVGLLCCTIL